MLKINSKCPSFIAFDEKNTKIDLIDFIGKKNIVLFFYPKDNTPGCTAEACSFRDHYSVFLEEDCEVFGISSDSSKSHLSFIEKHQLPFRLLTDKKNEIRSLFKVPDNLFGLIPGRVSYVIDKKGLIKGAFNSQLNPKSHIKKALKCIQGLQNN